MLEISNGGKRREVITPVIHKILEEKLNDNENPFLGYKDARKSHYKKDEQAIEAFKKTS